MSSLPHRNSIRLPQDITALIAAEVASGKYAGRTNTLRNSMLACRAFAHEFRAYLFDTLYILESDPEYAGMTISKICAHVELLKQHPGWVKEVIIELSVQRVPISSTSTWEKMDSIAYSPHFASWLVPLTDVSSLSLEARLCNFNETLVFSDLPHESSNAILQLCSLPSMRSLIFENIGDLSPRVLYSAPNLEYLSLGSVIMAPEDQTSGILMASSPLHVHIPHHRYGRYDDKYVDALEPIWDRIWKLSGCEDEPPSLLAMLLPVTAPTLLEADITISGGDPPTEGTFSVSYIEFRVAKKLKSLRLNFKHSVNKSITHLSRTPDLSVLLNHLIYVMFPRSEYGAPESLSHVIIEMHDIPSHCLSPAAIEREKKWEDLDRVLSDPDNLPSLDRLELRLFIQDDGLSEEEWQAAADLLLPSLPGDVLVVTIDLDETSRPDS